MNLNRTIGKLSDLPTSGANALAILRRSRHRLGVLLVVALSPGLAHALSKTISGVLNVPVNAVTTWYYASCTASAGIGHYTPVLAPVHGTVTFGELTAPLPGCPQGSPPLPAEAAYYRWTDAKATPPASDHFQVLYQAPDGETELDDITVDLIHAQLFFTTGFESTDVTGKTQDVMIGQQIRLSPSLPPGAVPVTPEAWSIQGLTVGGFNVSPSYDDPETGAQVAGDFTDPSETTFYWVTPSGTPFEATFSFTLNGQVITLPAYFNVIGPGSVDVTTTFGRINIFHSWLKLGRPTRNSEVGINFDVGLPPPSGTFEWVQLIEGATITDYIPSTGSSAGTCEVTTGLETSYPYGSADATSTNDNPGAHLNPPFTTSEVMSARMFLMWDPTLPSPCTAAYTDKDGPHPSTCTSIPVPLGYVDWSWSGAAQYDAHAKPKWKIIDSMSSEDKSPFQTTSSFPAWTKRITGGSPGHRCPKLIF